MHCVRDNVRAPAILFVILNDYSTKAPSHCNPEAYIRSVIDSAMLGRHDKDVVHVDTLSHIITRSLAVAPTDMSSRRTVFDPTLLIRRGKRGVLMRDILAFAGSPFPDVYTQRDGWRRLPVNHMQALHATSEEGVRRAQVDLVKAGLIHRAPKAKRHDGGPRMDARIKLTDAGREALDAIRLKLAV